MTSGAADRLDVTAWIPSARSPSARSGWEAAGVAARSGMSAQDRFGAALSAAHAQDDVAAARARTASQRDAAAATQSRQTVQRDQADANRAATERARDAAVQAEARAADRRADTAKPASGPQVRPQGTAPAEQPPAHASAPPDEKDTAAKPQTRHTERTAAQPSEAAVPTRDAAPDQAATATPDAAQTDAAVSPQQVEPPQTQQPDPAAAPANTDPAAALLALLAALSEGGPIRTAATATDAGVSGTEDVPADGSVSPPKAGGAGSAGPAMAGLPTAGAAGGAPAERGAVSGITAAGAAATPPVDQAQGKAGKSPASVEGASTAPGDATSVATAKDTDFLAALADAGQGGGQGLAAGPATAPPQGAPPTAQGAPQPSGPPTASAGPSGAGQATATPQTAAPVQTDAAIPIGQVPMAIGLRSLGGSNEFQIRLDPAELGRIDVKLAIDKAHGTVMTHLVVDRPETLALLQRDAGQLQQALSQAGLDPSGGGLNLSLRGDGGAQGGAGGQQDNAPRGGAASWSRDQAEAPQEIAPTRWLRGYGGVDIRI